MGENRSSCWVRERTTLCPITTGDDSPGLSDSGGANAGWPGQLVETVRELESVEYPADWALFRPRVRL